MPSEVFRFVDALSCTLMPPKEKEVECVGGINRHFYSREPVGFEGIHLADPLAWSRKGGCESICVRLLGRALQT
jgi:hypothetical protein